MLQPYQGGVFFNLWIPLPFIRRWLKAGCPPRPSFHCDINSVYGEQSLIKWSEHTTIKKSVFVCTTPRSWHMRITFNLSFSGNVFLFRPVCQWKLVLWWTLGGEGELLLVFFSPPVYWATRAPFEQETSLPLIPQSGYCRPFDSSDYLTLGPYYTYRRDHTEAKNIPPEKKKMKCKHSRAFCLSRQYYICT